MNGANRALPSSHCNAYAIALAMSSALVTGGRLLSTTPLSPNRGIERRGAAGHPPAAHLDALRAQALHLLVPLGASLGEGDAAVGAQDTVPGQRGVLVHGQH